METVVTEPSKFTPILVEAKHAKQLLAQGNPFLFEDYEYTDDEFTKVRELVFLLTDTEMLLKYPNWPARAQYLDLPMAQLNTWRQTKVYKQLLVGAVKIAATEGLARALPKQIEKASEGNGQAFSKLASLAGFVGESLSAQVAQPSKAAFQLEDTLKQMLATSLGARLKKENAIVDEKPSE